MSRDSGRDAGISGLVDVVGAPQFRARIYMFKDASNVASIDNTGEGSLGQSSSRSTLENGSLLMRGKVNRAAYPVPTNLKDSQGTITILYDYTNRISKIETVRIDKCDFEYDSANDQNWDVTIIASRLGAPTYNNWPGTQVTPPAIAAGNSYLYAGRAKQADTNNIVDYSTQVIDVWGLADTDAAEVNSITAIIAAYSTPPQTWEKQYTATFNRTDNGGGRITIQWKPNNSADDLEKPRYLDATDKEGLVDNSVRAAVYTVGSPPVTPVAPVNQKLKRQEDYQINDHKMLRVWRYDLQDDIDDIETPKHQDTVDSSFLVSESTRALVYSIGTPPVTPSAPQTGLVLWDYVDVKLNDQKAVRIYRWATRTTVDDVTMPAELSMRSGMEATDIKCIVVTCTAGDTAEGIANTYFATYQSVPYFHHLTVTKLNQLRARILVFYLNPGSLVNSRVYGDDEYINAYLDSGDGKVKCYIKEAGLMGVSGGDNVYWIIMGDVKVPVVVRTFSIERQYTSSTAEEFPTYVNTVNNADFLGLGAGKVMYISAETRTNIDLASTYPITTKFFFRYISIGHFTLTGWARDFVYKTAATLTNDSTIAPGVGAGYTDIGITATFPTQNDFSVFTGTLP